MQASEPWTACEDHPYPAAIEQYEDILRFGGNAINLHLNTKHILKTDSN
ncbi:MAG: hypothetical protein AAF327_22650 [Cyanobacteria bacterium P01_A01_bin.37]